MHDLRGTVKVNPLGRTKIFSPIKIGTNTLKHRVVFAPSTRNRSLDNHVPSDLQQRYYDERTKVPGSLVITEATHISPRSGLYRNVPGIWNQDQVQGWSKVVERVHKNNSFVSLQLWNVGRVADPSYMKEKGLDVLSSSELFASSREERQFKKAEAKLRPATIEEIKGIIKEDYVTAAKNALEAGFDYIEIHAAHGYFLDQFMQSSSNHRTDEYGGSIENRAKIVLELVDELFKVVKPEQIGIRISPWMDFNGMKGEADDVHPFVSFGYLVSQLQRRANEGNELAYISIVEPRFSKDQLISDKGSASSDKSNQFIYDLWKGKIIRGGNYSYDAPQFSDAQRDVGDDRTLVAFSRFYISNPDLPDRLRNGYPLIHYDRPSFYIPKTNYGYNTFPRHGEEIEVDEKKERQVKSGIISKF